MPKIVISYRRSDSAWTARSIFDRLAAHYGRDSVFMDIDSIPIGIDFREHIDKALLESDVLIAIVGPKWLGPRDSGATRINDEDDPVRIEIEAALRCGIPIIPILVDGSRMPDPTELPASLAKFSFRNAAEVHAGRNFHQQIDHLLSSMDRLLEQKIVPNDARDARPDEPSASRAGAVGGSPVPSTATKLLEPADASAGKSRMPLIASMGILTVLLLGGWAVMNSTPGRDFFCGKLGVFCSETAMAPPAALVPQTVPQTAPAIETARDNVPRPPRPQTSPENCASPTKIVGVARYCASSVLPAQSGNSYGVQNLFSDDNTTAWVEGKPGQGIGEWVLIELDGPRLVQGLTIRTGYQKNSETFARNSRVSRIRLLFSQGETLKYDLQDRQGPQAIAFDRPIKAEWVQLAIEDVFPGSRFSDTAISKLFIATGKAD
jgi:hypothetical protein